MACSRIVNLVRRHSPAEVVLGFGNGMSRDTLTYCTVGAGGKYMLSLLGSRAGLLRIEVGQSSKL